MKKTCFLIVLLASILSSNSACAGWRFDALFDDGQTRLKASAKSVEVAFEKSSVMVRLHNSSRLPLCIPDAFLPQYGDLTYGSVSILDNTGAAVLYTNKEAGHFDPPFVKLLAIPPNHEFDILYVLGGSYALVRGERYRANFLIDAFDCNALNKGYVFPQRRPASEWESIYNVPAVDLAPHQKFTFEAETWFVAD